MRRTIPLVERFWNHVIQSDEGCWGWRGKTDHGYGSLGGRRGEKRVRATRFSWELHYGPIPKGLFVLHKCDNPPCSKPEHLFLGNQLANMRDASRKRRLMTSKNVGAQNVRAKIGPADVLRARDMREAGNTFQAIADTLGVSNSQAQRIAKNQVGGWNHVHR